MPKQLRRPTVNTVPIVFGDGDESRTPMGDGTTLNCSYHWMIPINLDEAEAVRIGNVEISVGGEG